MAVYQNATEMPADKHERCSAGAAAAMTKLQALASAVPNADWDIAHLRLRSSPPCAASAIRTRRR